MKGVYRLTVKPNQGGARLDQVLADEIEGMSRTLARRVIDLGGVHLDGRRVRRCSLAVRPGSVIEAYLDGNPLDQFSVGPEHVLLQDRWLLILDKPAGIETQPTPARFKGTMYEALQRYLADPSRPHDTPPLGMIQRLDRDTSGAMAFSIHPRAHKEMTRLFTGREAVKIYLALVGGSPERSEGEIRSLLAKQRSSNLVRSVKKGGKEAITRYKVVRRFNGAALVEIELLTGRSHQIRAHFSEMGHPLLGDTRYGGSPACAGGPVTRQMLHSWRLSFPHPVTGDPVAVEAPVPPDMAGIIEKLENQ